MNFLSLSLSLSRFSFSLSLFLLSFSTARQNAPFKQLSDGQFSQNSPENPRGQTQTAPLVDSMHVPSFWQRSRHTVTRVSQCSPVHSGGQLHFNGGGSVPTASALNTSSISFSFLIKNKQRTHRSNGGSRILCCGNIPNNDSVRNVRLRTALDICNWVCQSRP